MVVVLQLIVCENGHRLKIPLIVRLLLELEIVDFVPLGPNKLTLVIVETILLNLSMLPPITPTENLFNDF